MSEKKLFITDTILRDAHQSQAATRMRVEDMLPGMPDTRRYRILVARMLGRRNLRFVHALPRRGSVGETAPP